MPVGISQYNWGNTIPDVYFKLRAKAKVNGQEIIFVGDSINRGMAFFTSHKREKMERTIKNYLSRNPDGYQVYINPQNPKVYWVDTHASYSL